MHNPMTHDEMIAIIEAHKNGKTIQFSPLIGNRCDSWGNYRKGDTPSWDFSKFKYRIKPREPRRWFMALKKETGLLVWTWNAHSYCPVPINDCEIIEVQEVIHDHD